MERKKAIVTGASRGIGRGIALCLAKAGYDVAFSYVSRAEEAREVERQLTVLGARAYGFQAALEEPGAGVKLFEQAANALGGIDLLVNNAGVTKFEHILDLTEEVFTFLVNLDFMNYIYMMQAAARHMVSHGVQGNLINITSSRGERAYPGDCIYGGLKAALNRAVQSIALDLAPHGIRVNNIAPGATQIRTREELEKEGLADNAAFWETLSGRIPAGRCGTPEDIGAAVVFLASEQAGYITGTTLRIDGGLILPGMPERPDADMAHWGKTSSVYGQQIQNQKEEA